MSKTIRVCGGHIGILNLVGDINAVYHFRKDQNVLVKKGKF